MQGDRHFSHDHPLTLIVDQEVDDYGDEKSHSCKICGLPILSTPSYTCSHGCDFFLHKSCALKIHEKHTLPSHGPLGYNDEDKHTLVLRQGSPNFTYQCEDCNFEIHPLVALACVGDGGVELKTKHKSHPSHPLVACCKETACECDACGKTQHGFFFWCHLCNFWIHRDCTILPSVVTLASHPHPFLLAYSFPTRGRLRNCIVCHKPLLRTNNAIYFCPQTVEFAHASCGMEKIQSKTETRLELVQLPDDEWDTFPSLEIRGYSRAAAAAADDDGDGDGYDDDGKLTIEKFHNHPLIVVGGDDDYDEGLMLEDDDDDDIRRQMCNVCIQTINISCDPIFYRCGAQGCAFLAHKVCADLLPNIKSPFPDLQELTQVCPDPTAYFFNSIFYCFYCRLPCNGPSHYLPDTEFEDAFGDIPPFVDLLCMAAPSIIKHTSHTQHGLLYRTWRTSRAFPVTCCPNDSFFWDVYKCIICDFFIHIRCAFLPKRVRHESFDRHPLDLMTDERELSSNNNKELYCEVCEEGIEVKYWFYECGECEQSFHINCIPSVGYLSKVKFGGRLIEVACHAHPLTLTRMLTVGRNHKCGYCHQIIPGFVDQMAFCCSHHHCGFWIHFSCARDSCASTSRVFGEIDEQKLCSMGKRE